METSTMNIYQKMSKATMGIERVKKNLTVQQTKTSSYKAVGEGDVLAAVKPIEIELGIYSYPFDRNIIETQTLTVKSEYNGEVKERNQFLFRIETIYRFVNVDNPSEYIDVKTYGDGVDGQDKSPGKAMTYADKYALLKAYKIETGDDPDKDASQEVVKATRTESKATPKQIAMLQQAYLGENLAKLLQFNGVSKIEDLPMQKASELVGKLLDQRNNKK